MQVISIGIVIKRGENQSVFHSVGVIIFCFFLWGGGGGGEGTERGGG